MISIAKIIDTIIVGSYRKIKLTRFGRNDHQTPYHIAPYGIDSVPIDGVKAVHSKTTNIDEPICLGVFNVSHVAQKGEYRIYSQDSNGNIKTEIHLKNDGTISIVANGKISVSADLMELLGTGNFLTKYNEMKSAFDSLKNTYNSHTHAVSGSATAVPNQPSAADMSGSKADKLKTGS